MKILQPFHLVTIRPWPILISFSLIVVIIITINLFYNFSFVLILHFLGFIVILIFIWWRDVIRERYNQGFHTTKVLDGLKLGIILFIISELFFFIRFFWCYFHSFLSPNIQLGLTWPPVGIKIFNPFLIPLLNTLILLSSGITVTLSHYYLINNELNKRINYLFFTIILGGVFSLFQLLEYLESRFCIRDRVYGSIFFIGTGFHGLHVLIGTLFLFINLIRILISNFSSYKHFRFEAASWYWHFVDVIWLFLYLLFYYWSW